MPGVDANYDCVTPDRAEPERRPVLTDISVVIPTLGRAILQQSLACIACGNAWPACLIVVDQGTNSDVPGWINLLERAGMTVTHIQSRQRGRAAGINLGLKSVTTRFVAITDDDCFVDSQWLTTMQRHLSLKSDCIITGRVEPAGDDEAPFCVVKSLVPKTYYRPELRAQPLIGGNMGVAMANVERIGPFDEDPCIHSAEDSDWGYRALRFGIPIIYDPAILVHHFSWRDSSQRQNRYRQYARSQGGFYGKHMRGGDPLIFLQAARDLIRGPVRWVRGVLKADPEMISSGRADSVDLLPGIVLGLRSRPLLPPSNAPQSGRA